MKLTISVLKADIGSPGGHTKPADKVLDAVRSTVSKARGKEVIDYLITYTGDDIAITMTHERGVNDHKIHQLAWDAFKEGTAVAQRRGDYGAGQDLLVDAPSGNIRGAGPAVAELEFDHKLSGERAAESVMIFAADKCGPGAYSLPVYLAFADPMYCGGLILKPELGKGFTFRIMDMDFAESDRLVDLTTPEEMYSIVGLLRDETRYAIEGIFSRAYPHQQVAAISTQRLHNIAGKYTGKDDPVAIIRTQSIFPAPEEIVMPWASVLPFVTGDCRGSHVLPITPYPVNTPVRSPYCQPIVSSLGISINREGRFSDEYVDFFADTYWEHIRRIAVEKGLSMRSQGWFGVAMANNAELSYTGLNKIYENLEKNGRFFNREKEGAAAAK
ncbi:MAG: fructose 1,6-bisphosphatase [Planctomycetes bacterium]|nr:fructose 1,6-bisphosphatase [Planctomycetota bacterium]